MKRSMVVSVVLAALLLVAAFGIASAHGHSAGQLKNWDCIPVPPNGWVHCVPPPLTFGGLFSGDQTPASVQVKVFNAEGDEFLGAEILIRADLYNGQPCMTDGGDEYDLLPFGYYACHHFDTSE